MFYENNVNPSRFLTIGEPMALFIAHETGPLSDVSTFSIAAAGAELNVAIGLARLGHAVRYITRLGHDPFGQRIAKLMQANNLDVSGIIWDTLHPTGMMLKGRVDRGDPPIAYFRSGSAASTLSSFDIAKLDLSGYEALLLTGIFPALSPSTMEAAFTLLNRAKALGIKTYFDPNLRPSLWPSRTKMAETLHSFAQQADVFMPGVHEGEILMGDNDPEAIASHFLALGSGCVVVKLGDQGAYAATAQEQFYCPSYPVDHIVDTVGAGDGFAAGLISGLAEGLSLRDAVLRGNAIGALQLQSAGDNENLPTREALYHFQQQTV